MIREGVLLRHLKFTSQKLGGLAHSHPLFKLTLLEGEMWFSKTGSYLPRNIWNFLCSYIRLSYESWQGLLWQMVTLLMFAGFFCLADSLFLPCLLLMNI